MRAFKRLSALKRRFDLRARWLADRKRQALPLLRHWCVYRRARTLATLSWLLWM